MSIRARLVPVLAALVGLSLVPAISTLTDQSAQAAPAAKKMLVAKNDRVTVTAGSKARVRVLANDVVRGKVKVGKRKVKNTAVVDRVKHVKTNGRAHSLPMKVNKKRVVVITTRAKTAPGVYRVKYRIKDKAGRVNWAFVRLTVKAAEKKPAPAPKGNLVNLIEKLPVAAEKRDGYDRDAWKHWNSGLYADGCDTRQEVLAVEAIIMPTLNARGCVVGGERGGSWYSYFDGVTVTNSTNLDIDHLVPLAEAHDSGGHSWDAATREAYANDQGDPRSLVAVTASANRGKGDRDPGEWWPLKERCRYAGEWVAVKTRWGLSIDTVEKDALLLQASQCGAMTVQIIKR